MQVEKPDLKDRFNALQAAHPELVDGAALAGGGNFGLVVRQADCTISKFLFRHKASEKQQWAELYLENEVSALRLLNGRISGEIETPVLLSDPVAILDDENFFASYKMTSISGTPAPWLWRTKYPGGLNDEQRQHFRAVGQLQAQLHKSSADLIERADRTGHVWKRYDWMAEIDQVASLDDKTNRALEKANAYLQAHRKSAVIHADYYGGNIMNDQSWKPTGLLDFAHMGISANHLTDMLNIPPQAYQFFKEGYEQETGQPIDPLMIVMTEIAGNTAWLKECGTTDRVAFETASDELNKKLGLITSVTGFKPPQLA